MNTDIPPEAAPQRTKQMTQLSTSQYRKLLLALNVAVSWLPGDSPDRTEAKELEFVRCVCAMFSDEIKVAANALQQKEEQQEQEKGK